MQAANANGVPVIIVNHPGGGRSNQDKRLPYTNMGSGLARGLIALGSLHMVFGILGIILQAVQLNILVTSARYMYFFSFAPVGHGLWSGIIFVITGSFGIFGGVRKSRCSVIVFSIFSLISVFLTVPMLILSMIPSVEHFRRYNSRGRFSYTEYDRNGTFVTDYDSSAEAAQRISAVMELSLVIVAFLEAIVAICSSVICCKIGACCCDCDGLCCCPPDWSEVNASEQEYVSPQQQFTMSYLSDQALAGMMANQQTIFSGTDTGYQKLNTHLGPSDCNAGLRSSEKDYDNERIYAEIYDEIIE